MDKNQRFQEIKKLIQDQEDIVSNIEKTAKAVNKRYREETKKLSEMNAAFAKELTK